MIKRTARGTQVEVSSGFLLLLAWLHYMDQQHILPLALLACIFHEWGHYWMITHFEGEVTNLRLTVVGAEMSVPSSFSYGQECMCALAGPLVNIVFGVIFAQFPETRLFSGLNLALAGVNLLPMSRLDGGRTLSFFMKRYFSPSVVEQCCHFFDVVCACVLLAVGVWIFLEGGTVTLLLLGGWLIQVAV